jgi:hypothetical protein
MAGGNAELLTVGWEASKKMNECYRMTGQTDSWLYMAPEVIRQEPYNEKVCTEIRRACTPPSLCGCDLLMASLERTSLRYCLLWPCYCQQFVSTNGYCAICCQQSLLLIPVIEIRILLIHKAVTRPMHRSNHEAVNSGSLLLVEHYF